MLGPFLFILYVNDRTDGEQSTLEIFAEIQNSTNPYDMDSLQQDLNYISSWSKLWLLNFNTTKCSVMHLGKNSNATYTYIATNSNTVIQSTTEQKDLGVWTTSTTNFTMHCHKATSKANEALGIIKQNFNICPNDSLQNICPTTLRVLCPNLEPSLL